MRLDAVFLSVLFSGHELANFFNLNLEQPTLTERIIVDDLIVIMYCLVNSLNGAGDRGVQVRNGLGGLNLTTGLTGGDRVANCWKLSEDNLAKAVSCYRGNADTNGVANDCVLSGIDPLVIFGVK